MEVLLFSPFRCLEKIRPGNKARENPASMCIGRPGDLALNWRHIGLVEVNMYSSFNSARLVCSPFYLCFLLAHRVSLVRGY